MPPFFLLFLKKTQKKPPPPPHSPKNPFPQPPFLFNVLFPLSSEGSFPSPSFPHQDLPGVFPFPRAFRANARPLFFSGPSLSVTPPSLFFFFSRLYPLFRSKRVESFALSFPLPYEFEKAVLPPVTLQSFFPLASVVTGILRDSPPLPLFLFSSGCSSSFSLLSRW